MQATALVDEAFLRLTEGAKGRLEGSLPFLRRLERQNSTG
jgi:hypothetical protein